MRNALDVRDINNNLLRYGLPPRKLNPNRTPYFEEQNRYNAHRASQEKEVFIDEGCRLSLMIDNVKLNFNNYRYRFSPSDDLIEGIRAITGFASVRLEY